MAADDDGGRWCQIYEERAMTANGEVWMVGCEASEGSLRTSGRFLCDSCGVKGRLVFGVFGWNSEENKQVLSEEGEEKIRR